MVIPTAKPVEYSQRVILRVISAMLKGFRRYNSSLDTFIVIRVKCFLWLNWRLCKDVKMKSYNWLNQNLSCFQNCAFF